MSMRGTLHLVRRLGAAALVVGLTWGSVVGLAAVGAQASERVVALEDLSPNPQQKQATRIILDLIRRYHYRKVPLDDALSEQMFDRYMEELDPNRSFFLASDIQEFSTERDHFDEALRMAEIAPAFAIFKRFRERIVERADAATKLLDYPFDFTRAESYQFNREDEPWAASVAELDEIWRKRVKNDVLELRLAGRSPPEIHDTLAKRYERMGRRVSQLNANDVYQFFVNAYTVSIEPHTAYFSPRTSENFRIRMSLSLEGIGAALQTENEYTVVRRVIPGGPADRSKQLHVGDRVVGVGQGKDAPLKDVVSWRLEDVVDLIRGPKGSVVRLQVLPAHALPGEPTRTMSLVRDRINLEDRAAKSSVVTVGKGADAVKVGVINVPTFYLDSAARAQGVPNYRSTTRDVHRLVRDLEAQGVVGIVVDLRGNSGGALLEATELTGLFIKSGPVVQIKDSRGHTQVNEDQDGQTAYDGPLAVLVDRRSASASEIFSAAIQDYQRGVILGEPTFGKGTVQNLFDLDRRGGLGQLKVTIAQFFRINGEGTQHRGVVPDIVFPTADDSRAEGERALDNALPWASIKPAVYKPVASQFNDYADARRLHEMRMRADPKFKLLMEEIEGERKLRDLKSISLVESERKQDFERRRAERDAREQRLRKALGLPPAPPETASAAAEEPKDTIAAEERAEQEEKIRDDIVLDEAARILVDIIHHAPAPPAPAQKVADSAAPAEAAAAGAH